MHAAPEPPAARARPPCGHCDLPPRYDVPIVAAPNASRLRDDAGRGAWDIRARRLALHGGVLLGRFRRALSILALLAIDVCGLALALYAALATARIARG